MSTENRTNWVENPTAPQNNGQNRRRLTKEEAQQRREIAEKRRRARRSVLVARLIFMAVIYVLICAIFAGVLALMYSGSYAGGRRLEVVNAEGETLYSESAASGYIDGKQYISATGLSALCKFTLAGDSKEVTMYFHDIGQHISFTDRSAVVEINGEKKRLSSEVFFKNDYYIPLELIENYFCGVTIEQGKAGTLLISATGDGLSLRSWQQTETEPA